jgi:hypothetical protein
MDEPIEYVGGEPERPPVRPWWLLGVIPALLGLGVLAVVVGPGLVASARGFTRDAVPYTVQVSGTWSSGDQVVEAPVTLTLDVKNTDSRPLEGMTVRLGGLAPHWRIVAVVPDGEIASTSVYFGRTLNPGESESLELRLLPLQAGSWQLRVNLAAGRGGAAIRLVNGSGTARGLVTTVAVRNPSATDLGANAHLYYSDPNLVTQPSLFRLHVDNTGAVRITSVTVRFAQLPSSFELRGSEPRGVLGADGRSVTFDVALDPSQGTDLSIEYVPHQTGTYHVSIQFLLGQQTDPVVLSDGSTSIGVDIRVH